MTPLMARHRAWRARRQATREADARNRLRTALGRHLPGVTVWVYGSLAVPGRFADASDIDLALETLPPGESLEHLQSVLSSAVGREVDVCRLDRTRLRDRILATGERWTP